jgi:hypothetical protein
MSRKSTDLVAVTLRIREGLRYRLEVAAGENDVSLNAEMERRLQNSFEIANTESLIRALVGGEPVAELLGAIAKAFELRRTWKEAQDWPKGKADLEAAYIALIVIFSELFSTPKHPLDPTLAHKMVAAMRRRRGSSAVMLKGEDYSSTEMAGVFLAQHVLSNLGYSASGITYSEELSRGGLPAFTRKKRGAKS